MAKRPVSEQLEIIESCIRAIWSELFGESLRTTSAMTRLRIISATRWTI